MYIYNMKGNTATTPKMPTLKEFKQHVDNVLKMDTYVSFNRRTKAINSNPIVVEGKKSQEILSTHGVLDKKGEQLMDPHDESPLIKKIINYFSDGIA